MSQLPVRVGVVGASGRMGRQVIHAILDHPEVELVAALDRPGASCQGQDVSLLLGGLPLGVQVGDDLASVAADIDVLIDFTVPEATLQHLAVCAQHNVGAVIGTTGFTPEQRQELDAYASRLSMVWSPNMSAGVNVVFELLKQAASALAGGGYDVEVLEAHHRHKIDAPSGTALKMGELVAQGMGVTLAEKAIYSRAGITGVRPEGAIGFSTIRGGDIPGEHTVLFIGEGERIEITHRATSRAHFAEGAVRAARWLAGQPAGLYSMAQVLGFKTD